MGQQDGKQASVSVVGRIRTLITEQDLMGMAKEITYDILFSLAPLLIFFTAAAGWITQLVNSDQKNPAEPVLRWMTDHLPSEAADFLREPVENALTTSPGFLLTIGGLLALWSAKNAMSGVIKGLNRAYGVEDVSRGLVLNNLIPIGLTVLIALLAGVAGLLFVLGTGVGEDIAGAIGLGTAWTTVSTWLRWPVIAVVVVIGVAAIHQFGPNVDAPFRWFLPGAALTVVGIAIATVLLGLYFQFTGGYSKAYGTFGAVLAFIYLLWVASLMILIGGALNMALQTTVPGARAAVEKLAGSEDNDNQQMLAYGGEGSDRIADNVSRETDRRPLRPGEHPWDRADQDTARDSTRVESETSA